MNRQKIKIKAAFLLMVFALNTVVSFACSVGLDMRFNEKHYEHTVPTPHTHEKPHAHSHDQAHSHGKPHAHDAEATHSHSHTGVEANHRGNDNQEENNCCSDEVVKFSELDKSLSSTNQYLLKVPVAVLAALYTFFLPDYYGTEVLVKPKLPFVRSSLPTHTDLRIVIQSFQI